MKKIVHLKNPKEGGNKEDDAEDEFEDGDDRVGILKLQLQVKNFELFF